MICYDDPSLFLVTDLLRQQQKDTFLNVRTSSLTRDDNIEIEERTIFEETMK